MNIFKNLIEDIRGALVNPYKDGARHAAVPNKIIFIDPKKLKDPDMSKNVAYLRKSLESQMPGVTGKPSDPDSYLTDDDLEDIITISPIQGPFAVRADFNGKTIGLVNMPDSDVDNKSKLMPLLTGVPLEKMRHIPGPNYLWQRAVSVHEGEHVNQPDANEKLSADEQDLITLRKETGSDKAMIK